MLADEEDRPKESSDAKEPQTRSDDDVSARYNSSRLSLQLTSPPQPIDPILAAINSLDPITPEYSTMLLSSFMSRKQALGQAGQQTPGEQQAISELLRRATEDTGGSSVLGVSTGSGSSRSSMISRTGRGLFDIPVREKGLARSSSHSVLAGSPARNRTLKKSSLGSPATPWRPLHASTLGQSQSSAPSDPSGSQRQELPEKTKVTASGHNGQLSHSTLGLRQSSGLSKSTSMFTMSRHSPNRHEASPDLSKSTTQTASTTGMIVHFRVCLTHAHPLRCSA